MRQTAKKEAAEPPSGIFNRIPPLPESSYSISQSIWRGPFTEIFAASGALGKAAVKTPRKEYANHPLTKTFFDNEFHSLSFLKSPGIVSIIDYYMDCGPAIVMELLSGRDFHTIHHILSMPEQLKAFLAVCDSLSKIHLKGAVHRDIKPANIMIETDGQSFKKATLIDFACTQLPLNHPSQFYPPAPLGTVYFIAPEQTYPQDRVDGRADIYSLGMSMYFVLSGGKFPFSPLNSMSEAEWINLSRRKRPASLEKLMPSIPSPICPIVHKAIEKNPDDRFHDVLEMKEAIEKT
ncbi:serine/threonine protein kinase, partial [Candidatus Micrarchaeota archaeon]|nr:serine/threonine protein kinase [Candidatus Micrarchaeota archaeon]